MNRQDQAAIFRFPCDGVPRYRVGKKVGLTYSQAYDELWEATGCRLTEKKERILTLEGVQRIKSLNQKYLSLAQDFVAAWFAEQKKVKETPP